MSLQTDPPSRGPSIRRGARRLINQLGWEVHRLRGGEDGLHPAEEDDGRESETRADRDWRAHFTSQLAGRGLELGPLHQPMIRHDRMQVEYLDRLPVSELRRHYPELADFDLVEPDILGDAETLTPVADATYDFLIASHVIEHMRNPIGALEHWCRVVRPGGLIYLVAPDKRGTFDRRRVQTPLEHLILDWLRPSLERDYEHFLDWAAHLDQGADHVARRGLEAIREADQLRDIDYSIHFHVFIPVDVLRLLHWFSEYVRPVRIVEGPCLVPGAMEFHFLVEVGPPDLSRRDASRSGFSKDFAMPPTHP